MMIISGVLISVIELLGQVFVAKTYDLNIPKIQCLYVTCILTAFTGGMIVGQGVARWM